MPGASFRTGGSSQREVERVLAHQYKQSETGTHRCRRGAMNKPGRLTSQGLLLRKEEGDSAV